MPPCHLYINVSDLYVSARSLGNLCRRLVGGWKRTEFSGRCVCGSESNKWEFPGLMSEVETKKIKWKIDWQFYCQWRRKEKSFISNNCQDEAKLGKLRQMHHFEILERFKGRDLKQHQRPTHHSPSTFSGENTPSHNYPGQRRRAT